jgi:RNA polymerase sigma-70 factor (ECF subfamily)
MTPAPVAPSDADLLTRAAHGDERAVATLFDRFAPVLHAVAFRILRDRADAEEVVVDAFAQAWRESERFDATRGSVAAWLTVIARSRALDLLRARTRRERLTANAQDTDPMMTPGMGEATPPTDARLGAAERRKRVAAALALLSEPQRTAIELAFFEGLSHSEIAERLAQPLGTIKTRVRLGMQKLRDELRPYFFEGAT